jgi:serine/threonine protein kinase
MIDDRNHITLIDFGAAHEHSNKANSSIFAVKDGYSPYEFYIPKGKHEFSSDLYSLGATFHYLITGYSPPDSYTRLRAITSGKKDPYTPLASGDWPFDYNLLATIDHALKMRQKSRLNSTAAWRKELASLPKKRPAPPKLPVFDPNLESEISRLVNLTNQQLQRVHGIDDGPSRKRSTSDRQWQPSQQQSPKLVDIFGNPIDDIETWQEEQEFEIRSRRSVQDMLEAADNRPRSDRFLPNKHLISELIWRCVRKIRPENLRQTRF